MSDTIEVKSSERGVVRLFDVDLPAKDIATFVRRNGNWPLCEALGAEYLDQDRIEVFDVADLTGVGLAGYLQEGMGIPSDQIAPLRERLNALAGAVLVVPSSAFGGTAQTLTPRAPLSLVASLMEAGDTVTFRPLPDESARSGPESAETAPIPKKTSDSAMSGRVAMIALLLLALLVALMVWVAA